MAMVSDPYTTFTCDKVLKYQSRPWRDDFPKQRRRSTAEQRVGHRSRPTGMTM